MRITFLPALAVSALALAVACSGEAPAPQPPDAGSAAPAEPAQEALAGPVEAERAFAADAARIGWIDAYPNWAAQDGVVLQNGISSALEFAANINPQVRGDTSLAWGPEFAGMSAAGDFGFTAGPFNGDGAAFGYYLTVWRKQPDGAWKWLFEGGVDTLEPTIVPAADAPVQPVLPLGQDGDAQKAASAVTAHEQSIAEGAQKDAAGALRAFLWPVGRVQREGSAPATDTGSVAALLARDPAKITYTPKRLESSAAGDLVFSLGEAKWDGGSGHYTRIWMRMDSQWQIVFDQIVPE